jgi:acetyl-CoA C-acetyltransferase
MQQSIRKVAVIGGVRTPFCRGNTGYDDLTNLDLMTAALNGLVAKYHLEGEHIDEVVGGAVVTHSKDFNLTREAVIGTKLKEDTPGVTLAQACGTSLQAALGSAAKIAIGQIDSAIATGSDTVSDPPIVFQRKFAKRLARVGAAKGTGGKIGTFTSGFSFGELTPNAPSVAEPRTGLSMGQHCELMAQEFGITRAEQDQLAYESHKKAAAAYNEGFQDDLLVPTAGVFRDNNLREDINLEKIAQLRPAFEKSERGTLTAANSTPLTDGASAVLLSSEEWAAKRGLTPMAYLTYGQHYGIDFVDAGKGLLMAPTIAVSKMLDQAGLTLQDFDFYEIHEAFAAQVLCTLKAWEDPVYCKEMLGKDKPLGSIDRSKLNVKGSSLAYGHPFAATGGRIIAILAKILEENGGGRGLISICTAGGMGVCAIMERPRTMNGGGRHAPASAETTVPPQNVQAGPADVQPLPAAPGNLYDITPPPGTEPAATQPTAVSSEETATTAPVEPAASPTSVTDDPTPAPSQKEWSRHGQ